MRHEELAMVIEVFQNMHVWLENNTTGDDRILQLAL